jgi:hypothetical protein
MTGRAFPLLVLPFLLGSCISQAPPEDQARLASACELTKCRCVGERTSVFRNNAPTAPVRWRSGGGASCDAGLHLERVSEEKRPGY